MEQKISELSLKSVRDIALMQEDFSSAISSLPDFGYSTKKNLEDIKKAQAILNDLQSTLETVMNTSNTYRSIFDKLQKLLSDAGVSDCVDDLVAVRKNSRRKEEPLFGSSGSPLQKQRNII